MQMLKTNSMAKSSLSCDVSSKQVEQMLSANNALSMVSRNRSPG